MTDDPKMMGLDNAHYAAVGRVASSWASFEMSIDDAVQKLAGLDEKTGTCITAQIAGSARKLDALVALVRLRGGNSRLLKELNRLCEDARGLAEIRNRIVHDPWMKRPLPDSPTVNVKLFDAFPINIPIKWGPHRVEMSARRKVVVDFVYMPSDKVESVRKDIEALDLRLFDMTAEFRKLLASPETRAGE